MASAREPALAVLVAVVHAAALLAAQAPLPFFSDTYCHLANTAMFASVWDAFDPQMAPLRPLQHAYFWLLNVLEVQDPLLARAPGHVMHVASALLVFVLVGGLGGGRTARWMALLAFLAFPHVKALAWVAAVNAPGRVVFTLAGLVAAVHHHRRPRAATGATMLGCWLGALAFHQSAMVVPVLYLLLLWGLDGGSPPGRRHPIRAWLRDPWLWAIALLALAYVAYLTWLPQRTHRVLLDAVPANAVKGSLSLAPEMVRLPLVEALRGTHGALWRGLGLGCMGGFAALGAWWAWRGGPIERFLLAAIAIDLALPILSTGFVLRYAHLASALFAAALAVAWQRAAPGTPRLLVGTAVLLLAAGWARDTVAGVRGYREAGRIVLAVLADARSARHAAGGDTPILVVDLPAALGKVPDIPLFNWGAGEALRRHAGAGPWHLVRTHDYPSSTDIQRLEEPELRRCIEGWRGLVLVYDPQGPGLRLVDPGSR